MNAIPILGFGFLLWIAYPQQARWVSTIEYKIPMDTQSEPGVLRFRICSQAEFETCETKSKFMALELKERYPSIMNVRYECELKEWYERLGDCQQR